MLSRVAESVYWMGRYVERAENTARLLDVSLRFTRELAASYHDGSGGDSDLRLMLQVLGAEERYAAHHGRIAEPELAAFVILDPDNPDSVVSCISTARDNARAVRESISTEMWEELNRAYLALHRVTPSLLLIDGIHDFCRQIRLASQLFQGVTDATMPHDEPWHFLQTGIHLERAGMTARILASRAGHLEQAGMLVRPEEAHRWFSLLRSVSAYEAYLRLRPGGVQPVGVAEFLLLSRDFPRSVAFGVQRVFGEIEAIDRILGINRRQGPGNTAGALAARLRYTSFDDLAGGALLPFLTAVLQQLDQIGNGVRRVYFESAVVAG